MELDQIQRESHDTAVSKGWDDIPRSFPEFVANMHGELTEAWEEYRLNGTEPDTMIYLKQGKPEGIAVEFADLVIRLLDCCAHYDIPLEDALKVKMEYNKGRPYRHGNKVC
ncbi:hypothetical protein LCGC14_2023360 [marine sediment metagenome]|uniref:NTP pyrophosphohydrolase MazG putative catalytic core domain-containing protein n=1 Tax=marine sediment metagenome TaxID=412755 RepID=A0A0F9EWV9_9ZZZZ